MSPESDHLIGLAASVSDGRAVDWEAAEASASSDEERAVVRQMRLVADLVADRRGRAGSWSERRAVLRRGERWGALEAVELLGAGGFGQVYRARDTRLNRDVALKLFLPRRRDDLAAPPRPATTRSLAEAQRLAQVRHPNVVTVYGAEEHDGRPGLWMELVRGRTLEALVRGRGALGEQEAARIGIDLCRALGAIHGAGLIHGDLKANNVMREEDGRIVLMDLGGDRPLAAGAQRQPSCATAAYVAPELLRGHAATESSDIYSLGVLLFYLVSAELPVAGPTFLEVAAAHDRGERRRLRDLRWDLSDGFVAAVERALAPDSRARFGCAGEMERALVSALNGRATPAPATGVTAVERASRRRWRLPVVVGGTVLVTLAAGIALRGPLGLAAASYSICAVLLRQGSGSAAALAPGARVAPGDALFLELEASRPVHVYVLNEDEHGEAYLLFPLPGLDPVNPLAAKQVHRLPGARSGRPLFWQVTSRGGREHFLLIASPKPLTSLLKGLADVPRAGAPSHRDALPLSPRAISGLRGVADLVEAPHGAPRAEASGLFERARRLAAGAEQARGVWIRQIDLENP